VARRLGTDALPEVDKVVQTPGVGAAGVVEGRLVAVGKATRSPDESRWHANLLAARDELTRSGMTGVLVVIDNTPAAVIGLIDSPTPTARDAVDQLRRAGLHAVILSGDHHASVQNVAREVGIDTFHTDLSPDEKLHHIRSLRQSHGSVAMVGDGVNDAPALAAADLGVAMGAAGTPVAIETADVVLMHHDLRRLADATRLGRSSRRVIAQNLLLALAVILVVAPSAAMGYTPLGLAVLLHEGSTVLVVLNALRLLRFAT
jgi:Zn2+/Cd2+-exporting ATPase